MLPKTIVISPLLAVVLIFCPLGCDLDDGECGENGVDEHGELAWVDPPSRLDGYFGLAPELEIRLRIFDELWEELAARYAGFVVNGVDWDAARLTYRPQIEQATSYGRFYAVLSQLASELNDGHVQLSSDRVCSTTCDARPPVYFTSANYSSLGACVTLTDQEELIVYRVEPDNPAGLKPGDQIIGYDGVSWRENLETIGSWKLPRCGGTGTSERTREILRMESILNNAHLFRELGVKRRDRGRTEMIATSSILGKRSTLACTDQLPVEGVAFPFTHFEDFATQSHVSHARLPGTNIGYIYVYSQGFNNVWLDLPAAVQALFDTEALIIDQRFNSGNTPGSRALSLLFGEDVDHIMSCLFRDENSTERTVLVGEPDSWDYIDADESTFYNRPIALLTGPGAGSGGDIWPYKLSFHPRARRFGRSTHGVASGLAPLWQPDPYLGDISFAYTFCLMVDGEQKFLHGANIPPEEPLWLRADDIAGGTDTVVQAALDWIAAENSVH